MENPFLNRSNDITRSDYLTSVCSVNRIMLAKLPLYGVDDAIEGLTVKEFFSAKLVTEEIKKNAEQLHIPLDSIHEKKLPRMLQKKACDTADPEAAALARNIMRKFGLRLGLLLLALRLGEMPNRDARSDWSEAHWEYWKQINDIVLVGGLASGMFGETLRECVNEVFAKKGVEPYRILLYDNAPHVAVLGCAACIKERDGVFIVMDFGQTAVKRSCIIKRDGEISEIKTFESIPSEFMEWNMESDRERLHQAKALHAHLTAAVERTFKEARQAVRVEPSGTVVASIASYTVDGVLNDSRSGYAKLCALGANYAEILSWELSGIMRRDIRVKLIHDGTAVALNFRDRKNTVCLSVGSYFGIGFPETRIV